MNGCPLKSNKFERTRHIPTMKLTGDTPPKPTWTLKIAIFERRCILKTNMMFGIYVSFSGGICYIVFRGEHGKLKYHTDLK